MGAFAGPRIATGNLVVLSDPTNPRLYSGSGTSVTNPMGNGNSGTISNVTVNNQGFVFTGSSTQKVTYGPCTSGQNNTWSAWVNFISAAISNTIIWDDNSQSGNDTSVQILATNNVTSYMPTTQSGTNWVYLNGNKILSANTWYHVAVVTDPTIPGWVSYINGVVDATYTTAAATSRTGLSYLTIGLAFDGSYVDYTTGYPFNGTIADVVVYTRTLSQTEVQQNFNATRGRYGV